MGCVICHESLFEAPINTDVSNKVASSDTGINANPVALSCGHVYHISCITDWFCCSTSKTCPSCNQVHTGEVLELFIDHDMDQPQAHTMFTDDQNDSNNVMGVIIEKDLTTRDQLKKVILRVLDVYQTVNAKESIQATEHLSIVTSQLEEAKKKLAESKDRETMYENKISYLTRLLSQKGNTISELQQEISQFKKELEKPKENRIRYQGLLNTYSINETLRVD